MKVLPFRKVKKELKVILPNECQFEVTTEKLARYSINPDLLLKEERDGLIKLALGLIYGDYIKRQRMIGRKD